VVAASSRPEDASSALAALCQIYWKPVYAFIRRYGHDPDRARDLTQEFFARLIEKNYLKDADRGRGRFRSFLLTSVKYFLANEWDRNQALKRGGGQIVVSIDAVDADRSYGLASVDETPERLFERRWALSLLERVTQGLRAEFASAGKAEQFHLLEKFLSHEAADEQRYSELADRTGLSQGALRMAVLRMRRRYASLLRSEVAETVETVEAVDEEIRYLREILSRG
jgi:RNA polymerase sigma-70 factor (ECF subfamily)